MVLQRTRQSLQKCWSNLGGKVKSLVPYRVATAIVVTILLAVTIITTVILVTLHFSDSCITIGVPTGLKFESYLNVTRISWGPPEELGDCFASYRLIYNIDDGDKITIDTNDQFYEISHVAPCSIIGARLWSISGHSAEMSEDDIYAQYTELPVEIAPPFVHYGRDDEGLLLSWQKPRALQNCRIHYVVGITTDFGHLRQYEIFSDHLLVFDSTFCFIVNVKIASVYEHKRGSFRAQAFVVDDPVKNLTVITSDLNVQVSWSDHAKQVQCSLQYLMIYEIEGRKPVQVYVVKPQAIISREYCILAKVTVSVTYANTTCNATLPATIWPSSLGEIKELTVSDPGPYRNLTWIMGPELEDCKITYTLKFDSDMGQIQRVLKNTKRTYFRIPIRFYCFKFQVLLVAKLKNVTAEAQTDILKYRVDAPQDLNLKPILAKDVLNAKWKDNKQKQCNIHYKLAYKYGTSASTDLTIIQSADFELQYCTNATVEVVGVNDKAQDSETISAIHSQGDPALVGEVQNIKVVDNSPKFTIFWNLPKHMTECTHIEYKVVAVNTKNKNLTGTCTGTNICPISLTDFCPSTIFTVQPITYPGKSVTYTHTC